VFSDHHEVDVLVAALHPRSDCTGRRWRRGRAACADPRSPSGVGADRSLGRALEGCFRRDGLPGAAKRVPCSPNGRRARRLGLPLEGMPVAVRTRTAAAITFGTDASPGIRVTTLRRAPQGFLPGSRPARAITGACRGPAGGLSDWPGLPCDAARCRIFHLLRADLAAPHHRLDPAHEPVPIVSSRRNGEGFTFFAG